MDIMKADKNKKNDIQRHNNEGEKKLHQCKVINKKQYNENLYYCNIFLDNISIICSGRQQ